MLFEMARAFYRALHTLGYLPLRRPKFAAGGVIQGPRRDDDSIRVMLSPGYVFTARDAEVAGHGRDLLRRINEES